MIRRGDLDGHPPGMGACSLPDTFIPTDSKTLLTTPESPVC